MTGVKYVASCKNGKLVFGKSFLETCKKITMYDSVNDGDSYELFEWGGNSRACVVKYDGENDRFVRFIPEHWEVIYGSVGQSEKWKAEKERFTVVE